MLIPKTWAEVFTPEASGFATRAAQKPAVDEVTYPPADSKSFVQSVAAFMVGVRMRVETAAMRLQRMRNMVKI
jgi:hypothetical protein